MTRGTAPGAAAARRRSIAAVSSGWRAVAPVLPEVKVSALGTDAVVDGCLAEGTGLAWRQLTSSLLAAT